MTVIKQLGPDGAYCAGGSINGYSDEGQRRKETFLRAARALLKQTGQRLALSGWSEGEVYTNPAGPAVSGDVHADFWRPEDPLNTIYCTIGSSCVSLGGRRDGVIIMARLEKRQVDNASRRSKSKTGYRNIWMGANQWIDPGMDSQELAGRLLKIAGMPTGAGQDRVLPGCTYHSRTAGPLAIPSAIVRDRAEAEALRDALGAAIAAGRADARVEAGAQQPGEAKAGLQQLPLFGTPETLSREGEPCTG